MHYRNILLSSMILGALLITHPITAIQTAVILCIFLLVYFIRELIDNNWDCTAFIRKYRESNFTKILIIGSLSIVISLLFYCDFLVSGGLDNLINKGGGKGGIVSWHYTRDSYDLEDKHLADFFIAKKVSRMDQQEGIGIVLFSVCLIGLGLFFMNRNPLRKNGLIYLMVFLFYFMFLWIFTGGYFKFAVNNYRWWSILAIFVALHSASINK